MQVNVLCSDGNMTVCVCVGVCANMHTNRDVCSLQEVEVKDHQLNNEPGGEIKEKTCWSSNCYPQTAKLKLQGVGSVLFAAAAKNICAPERQMCKQLKSNNISLLSFSLIHCIY